MAGIRQPRAKRKPDSYPIRTGERDHFILEALGKMRFATTSQIAALVFGSRSAANKRLRKLLDAGMIRAWVRNLSQENIYALTRSALGILLKDDLDMRARYQAPSRLDGNLDHLLGINSVRVSFASNLAAVNAELGWWWSDWELRARGRERIIPDALFSIRWDGGGEQTFSLEVDHHTKNPRGFMQKVLGYASLSHQSRGLYGVSDFTVLVVGHDPAWVERYRASIASLPSKLDIVFTTEHEIQTSGPLGEIWRPVGTTESYSLRELGTFPYSREGSDEKTDVIPDRYEVQTARVYPYPCGDNDAAEAASLRDMNRETQEPISQWVNLVAAEHLLRPRVRSQQ